MKKMLVLMLVICLLFAAAGLAEEEPRDIDAAGTPYVTWRDGAYEACIPDQGFVGIWTTAGEFLAAVKEQSDAIMYALENDPLTQMDMNLKSEQLRTLWEQAMNALLEEVKHALSAEEAAVLAAEQIEWEENAKAAVDEAGKTFEGGSVYALIVNTEAATLTEARVYELYELI